MNQFYQMGLNPEQVGISFEMMAQRYIDFSYSFLVILVSSALLTPAKNL